MNKKEFQKTLEQAEFYCTKYFAVIVDLGNGEYELIVNHLNNLKSKYDYYMNAYDDDMKHKNAPIKIADVIAADNIMFIADAYDNYIKEQQ